MSTRKQPASVPTFTVEPEPDKSVFHKAGLWSVSIFSDPHWKPGGRVPKPLRMIVEIKYDGQRVYESHGRTNYLAAVEQINRWHASGHVPKFPAVKCLADLGGGAQSSCKKWGQNLIRREHVGESFLEGLK